MNSQELIRYYGNIITPSDANLFEFVLNEDGTTASIALSKSISKSSVTKLIIPYECEINTKKYYITRINSNAFSSCSKLSSVILPNTIEIIEQSAFLGCSKLKWIKLSNNVSVLEKKAFYQCLNLTTIVIPSSVTLIKSECFKSCTSLQKVIIEGENLAFEDEVEAFPSNTKIFVGSQDILNNYSFLRNKIAIYTKKDGIYYFCDETVIRVLFYDYNSIGKTVVLFDSFFKNIKIPKLIDADAFLGCFKMRVLEINEQVTIKSNTFTDCENLINVFINNNYVEVERNAFPINNSRFTIYINMGANLTKNQELQPYMFLFKKNQSAHNSNLFIAGVGNVDLFKGNDIVLSSKTLIDTGINLSVNLEDIQGNGGAKLYGKYASQAGMTIKFTEAMFKMEFLASNLGEDIELGGSAITMEHSIVQNGMIRIDGDPQPLYAGSEDKVVWVGEQNGQSKFISFSQDKIQKGTGNDFGKTLIKDVPFSDGTQVCVKYVSVYEEGQTIIVSSNYLPDEMTAILTAPLFAGSQNNLETATKIGTLTITIPRLMLSGNSDISMNMTGSSQMNIEGQALAVEESECDEGGYYAIISKIIKDGSWADNLAGLAIDNANHLKKGEILNVYGVFYGMGIRPLTFEQYVVLPSDCVDKKGFITYEGIDDLLLTVILKEDSNKITRGIVEVN